MAEKWSFEKVQMMKIRQGQMAGARPPPLDFWAQCWENGAVLEDNTMNRFGKTVIAVLALTVAAATAADAPLVPYRDPKGNFTMQVPKGWIVSSGGFDLLH